MTIHKHGALVACLLGASGLVAQDGSPSSPSSDGEDGNTSTSLLDRISDWGISIRRNVRGSKGLTDPAVVQYTHGSGTEADSTLLQAGLAWTPSLGDELDTRMSLTPFGEVVRNTDIAKEVESYQLGVSVSHVAGDPLSFMVHTQLDAAWKKVPTSDTEGSQLSIGFTPVAKDVYLNSASEPGFVRFSWDVMPGLVWENNQETGGGDQVRGTALARVRLYPLSEMLGQRLAISASVQYWVDLSSSGTFDGGPDEVHASTVRLDYILDTKERVGIGLDYFNGEDPDAGIKDTEYLQIAFTVKI